MENKQIYFAMSVGVLTMALGGSITSITAAGWSLLCLGAVLFMIALGVKGFAQSSSTTQEQSPIRAVNRLHEQLSNAKEIPHAT